MAVYRTVNLSFWTDTKVDDEFTPEDKYFYLFLITNPYTNITGCYEISVKQMAKKTGYNEETVKRLINRMEETHQVIKYDFETKEMLILNWYKYNWTKSKDLLMAVKSDANKIKNSNFREFIFDLLENRGTLPRGSMDPVGTTVTVTVTDTNTVINNSIKEIIDYTNLKLGKKYTYKNKSYNTKIKARLGEGFTVDDFKKVIDKKYDDWNGTEFEQYLDPDTLFAPSKFEKYLNQKPKRKGGQNGDSSDETTDRYKSKINWFGK